jgi:hypothetical protein
MNFSGLTVQPSYFRPVPNVATTPLQARPRLTSRTQDVNGPPINTRLRYKRFIGHIPLAHRIHWRRIARPPSSSISFFDLRKANRIAVPTTPSPSREMTTPEAPAESTKATMDRLFATAYGDIFGCTPTQARETLQQNDQALYQSWRNLTTVDEITWSPATPSQPLSAFDLAFAETSFASRQSMQVDPDEITALSVARYYLTHPVTIVIENDVLSRLYQGVLQRGLHWIDVFQVRQNGLSPAQILQTVCRYRRPEIATRSALNERLTNYRDVLADEAALIYFNAQWDWQTAQTTPMHVIRAHYATALIDEWQDISIGLTLLPSTPITPAYAKFWYDGVALQNARNKDIETIVTELTDGAPYADEVPDMQQIIDRASVNRHAIGQPAGSVTPQREALIYAMHGAISAIPRYEQRANAVNIDGAWLMRDALYGIVERAMRDLKLDICYPSGTPLNAVATIVLRLGPMHGLAFDEFNNPAALMAAYNRLQRAWRDDPHYAFAPSLCAAHYLAISSGVLFLNTQSSLSRDQQIINKVSARFLPLAIHADTPDDFAYWKKIFENILARRSKRSTVYLWLVAQEKKNALLPAVKAGVAALRNTPETIRYEDTNDLHRQLDVYLNQRLLAQAPLPVADQDFMITRILRQKLNMTDQDLHIKRLVEFPLPVSTLRRFGANVAFLAPPEEFKERTTLPFTKQMSFNGGQIDVMQEWSNAKASAAIALTKSPLIIAKATEILRQNAHVVDRADAERISASIANGIAGQPEPSLMDEWLNALDFMFGSPTVRTIVKAVASGEPRQILELLPFIIPLYDIEEGVRLADWRRVRDGAIHFGEDAIFTALGAIAERRLLGQVTRGTEDMLLARSRMSPGERAGVDMMHEMVDLTTPIVLESPGPESPVTIDEDTFNVRTATRRDGVATVPKMREILRRHPAGALPPLTLFLIDEERSIAVKAIPGGFAEIDRRGNIIEGAPIIFGDIESGRGYRMIRKMSQCCESALPSAPELMERETASQISVRWRYIAGLRNIRIRREDPAALIQALFTTVKTAPSTGLGQLRDLVSTHQGPFAKFKRFWQEVYARSDTAVVVLNTAYDNLIFRGQSEITFNAERAYVSGNNICLLGDKALADLQYVSLDGVTNFQRNRMWVHEAMHALGNWRDASNPYKNRGGTVYLTERILWEFDSTVPIPARLAYKIPPTFKDNEAAHRTWSENLFHLHKVAAAEDKILDRILDAGRDFSSQLKRDGIPVGDSITVRQGLALADFIKSRYTFHPDSIKYLFELVAASFDVSRQSTYWRNLEMLLYRSKTMRRLAAAWLEEIQHTRIKIKPVNFSFREQTQAHKILGHVVSPKTIWINTEKLYYFSDTGISEMREIRAQTGCLIDFFLRGAIPAEWPLEIPNRHTNRGLGVLLENEVLRQIGDDSPTRICLELTTRPGDYLRHTTFIRRGADLEDQYLRQTTRGGSSITDPAAIAAAESDILALSEHSAPWSP